MEAIDQEIYKSIDEVTTEIIDTFVKCSSSNSYERNKVIKFNNKPALILGEFIVPNIDADSSFINNAIQAAIDAVLTPNGNCIDASLIYDPRYNLCLQYPDVFKEIFVRILLSRVDDLQNIDNIITAANYREFYADNLYPMAIVDDLSLSPLSDCPDPVKIVYDVTTMKQARSSCNLYTNILFNCGVVALQDVMSNDNILNICKNYTRPGSKITIIPSLIRKEIFSDLYSSGNGDNTIYEILYDKLVICITKTIIRMLNEEGIASDEAISQYAGFEN